MFAIGVTCSIFYGDQWDDYWKYAKYYPQNLRAPTKLVARFTLLEKVPTTDTMEDSWERYVSLLAHVYSNG